MKKLGVRFRVLVMVFVLSVLMVRMVPLVGATTSIYGVVFANDQDEIDSKSWTSWSGDIDLTHWYLDALYQSSKGRFGYDSTKKAVFLTIDSSDNTGHDRVRIAIFKKNISVSTNFTITETVYGNTNKGVAVGAEITTKDGVTYAVLHASDSTWHIATGFNNVDHYYLFYDVNNTLVESGFTNVTFNPIHDLKTQGVNISASQVDHINIFFGGCIYNNVVQSVYLRSFSVNVPSAPVTLYLKDALSGQSLQGVTVKDGSTTIGTFNSTGTIELTKGQHTLTFEKQGYWTVTKTIDVQNGTSLNIELYPSSYVIIAKPSVSTVYQYGEGVATLAVSVVNGSGYGYSTKAAISGVSVSKVTWNGNIVNPDKNGAYYLGDLSGSGELKIYFKAPDSTGNKTFRVTFTTYDALANMKTNTYTITYAVHEPPFRVTLPTWKVGVNTVRITDESGKDRVITVILYNNTGSEVFSDSKSLLSYGAIEFNVPLNSISNYTLEVASNDGITLYFDVTAQVPIILRTKTVTVSGDTGTVRVEVSNSGSSVAYYKFVVQGDPISNTTKPLAVSLAPGETKTVNVPFHLKKGLTLQNYEATIKALDSQNSTVWSSTFIIKRSSGFSLPLATSTSAGLGLGALALIGAGGLLIALRRRHRR